MRNGQNSPAGVYSVACRSLPRFVSFVNPDRGSFQFSERRNALAFWIGSAVVSDGVVLRP
jgi:hypothetical protein